MLVQKLQRQENPAEGILHSCENNINRKSLAQRQAPRLTAFPAVKTRPRPCPQAPFDIFPRRFALRRKEIMELRNPSIIVAFIEDHSTGSKKGKGSAR